MGLHALKAEGLGSISGWGTKIPQARGVRRKEKRKKKKKKYIELRDRKGGALTPCDDSRAQ